LDTKLKKFNISALKKVVALILCLVCVAGCVHQVLTSIYAYDEVNLYDQTFADAIGYSGKRLDKTNITDTRTFRRHMENYASNISEITGRYGDGTEESYNQWKKSIEEKNKDVVKAAKDNLVAHVINDNFFTYLQLVEDKTVVPLGFIQASEYSGSTYGYEENTFSSSEIDYHYLLRQQATVYNVKTVPEEVQKKAEELGADGVFEINNFYQITSYDWQNESERVKETYQPGYYAFKIDMAVVEDRLKSENLVYTDEFGSASEFTKTYQMRMNSLQERYGTGRYFFSDGSGKVYTNIDTLSEKSTEKEIEEAFSALGFFCTADSYGNYYADGEFYLFSDYDYPHYDYAVPVVTTSFVYNTTTLPTSESTTAAPAVTHESEEEVTAPPQTTTVEVTMPETTRFDFTNDSTPFVNESSEKWVCYLGVDMYSDDFSEEDRFRTTASQIEIAKEIMLDFAITCGFFGLIFLVCFIYLIAKSGRRKGSEEVHLFKSDKVFTDWRIVIDCLLGWGVFLLYVVAVDYFGNDNAIGWFINIFTVLSVAFAAIVIDLVLFVTRHIKNRSLFRQISLVRLFVVIRKLYKDKVKPFTDEKFLYTKEFKKGTLIRIGAIVAANLLLVIMGTYESAANGTAFIYVLWLLFDMGVIVWVIRFVGGLHRILTALDEIRQGNYDIQINIYSLPATLRETAKKVMSLRDGFKTAVDEAVKQEQTKTELITNVSHDLKTPLTSIINYVELLKKCEISDENAKEYLGVLGEKSDRLKKLIEDLVEASKASTGNIKVELMQVSLNEMVSQLLGEHADGLDKKKLNVIADIPGNDVTVSADGKLLYRVMENLIVNVEKYSLYGTRVYVTVKEENGEGTVTFKNISEQPLNITADQLMERFVRGDESRSTEGNGLGLSIAKSLCELQNGELELTINGDLFAAKVKLGR